MPQGSAVDLKTYFGLQAWFIFYEDQLKYFSTQRFNSQLFLGTSENVVLLQNPKYGH